MNIPKLEINIIYLILLILLLFGILNISDLVIKIGFLSSYISLWVILIIEDRISLIGYSNRLPSKEDFVFIWQSSNKVRLYTRCHINSSLRSSIDILDCVTYTVHEDDYLTIKTKPIFFKKEVEAQVIKILENYQLTNKQ